MAYVREAHDQGAPTVAIVNDANSPLASVSDHVLECLAGPELSIPATKTVTAQMTLLAQLSVSLDDPTRHMRHLEALPSAVQMALDRRSDAASLAGRLAGTRLGSVIGRGFAFPPALEIALKLKETSYTRAEPFSAADFLHGPVALVEAGYAALLVDVGGRSSQSAAEIATAIVQRGGQPAVLRVGEVSPPGGFAGDVPNVVAPAVLLEPYAPIVALVLGQLVAIELALAIGVDPARPRGLHKVTSTR